MQTTLESRRTSSLRVTTSPRLLAPAAVAVLVRLLAASAFVGLAACGGGDDEATDDSRKDILPVNCDRVAPPCVW
jgi:hypothetical protein